MHIPDGYLSPSTCATLYGAAAPFWYLSLQQIKKRLSSRTLPLLSVVAAFSFVIMMFNLPLPGGTTGHAVGMGIAAIILGPWMAIAAISLALLVQALLFGDGGITAYGANCFNMAIVGSLVSFAFYKMIAYKAGITAKRRVLAAGLAGYAGINVAALCAAIEFGIQPGLFHDAAGTPLYAPYPLNISVPAMLIGHLSFAGLAEFVLSAGMVAYLQRADPQLLQTTAPEAAAVAQSNLTGLHPSGERPILRRLLVVLALILILSPLGIVAVGSAWGEWRARDYSNAEARQQIALASADHAPPPTAPSGLQKFSGIWQAPLPDYAPRFIRNTYFGYFVSACVGVGLILSIALAGGAIRGRNRPRSSFRRISFVEKTIRRFVRVTQEALFAEDLARGNGLLQKLDARAKMAGLGSLVLAATLISKLQTLLLLLLVIGVLAVSSRIPFGVLARRVWLSVFAFTGLVALPAIFLTPGQILLHGPLLPWTVTLQGLRTAAFLILRAECAASLIFLLTVTTPWSHILRSLRWFRAPAASVALLEISYRYVFVLLETAKDMFESRQTRLIGHMEPQDQRRFASSTAAVLFEKALALSGEVHCAMQARGFRGNIILLDDLSMTRSNWICAGSLVSTSLLIVWLGR